MTGPVWGTDDNDNGGCIASHGIHPIQRGSIRAFFYCDYV